MLSRKIKTFLKTNKLKLLIIILHRTFLTVFIKAILKIRFSEIVKKRAGALPELKLSEIESTALENFSRNGHVDVSHLFSAEDMRRLEEKTLELEGKISQLGNTKDHKKFWSRMTDVDTDQGNVHNIVNNIALNHSILKILHSYLKAPPFMEYSIITKSVYSGEKFQISQLWHQDKDDCEMTKLFIYINDVTEMNGPFTLLNRNSSKKIPTSFLRNHIQDEFIFKYVKPEEVMNIKGKKFSAFLVDTSKCFHMGSRISTPGQYRYMLTATFITLPSIYPWQITDKYKGSDSLPTLERLAVKQLLG